MKSFKSSKLKYTFAPLHKYYTPQRIVEHNSIVKGYLDYAKKTKKNKVYILGGGSGAGKSDFIKEFIIGTGEVDEYFLIVDADEVKHEIYDFIHWEKIISNPVSSREIDCSNPFDFVHDESSDIADQIIHSGISRNISFIYDGTFKNEDKYEDLIIKLNRYGYEIEIVILDVSVDVALDRVEIRSRNTGRDVPKKIVTLSNYKVAQTFFNLKNKGMIKNCSIFNNSINEAAPKLIAQFIDGRDDVIFDEDLYKQFTIKSELAKLWDRS